MTSPAIGLGSIGAKRSNYFGPATCDAIDLEIPAASGLSEGINQHLMALLMAATHSGTEMERRARLLECGLGYLTRADCGGVILFDRKGYLVKADTRAEQTLATVGIALDRNPRLRVEALDVTGPTPAGNLKFPDWMDPEWVEPIVEDGDRLGTAVLFPERSLGRALPSRGGLPAYKLRRVLEFIETNIDQSLALEDLAASAAVSPFHFHRQFKRSTGVTPHRYIVQVRMERAKSLLSKSELPLAEVAAQVGFADQSHFTSTFRRSTSMTPRSYRNATATV
jgi:AraC-like DNA-binding protein